MNASYPLQPRRLPVVLASAVLVPLACLCFYGAFRTRHEGAVALGAFLGVGLLALYPVFVGMRTLRARKGRAISVSEAGVTIPDFRSNAVTELAWDEIRALRMRRLGAGPALFRSLWVEHRRGAAEIRQQDLPTGGFEQLVRELERGTGRQAGTPSVRRAEPVSARPWRAGPP